MIQVKTFYEAGSLENVVNLALMLSGDPWAMVTVDCADGTAPEVFMSAADPALRALFDALAAATGDGDVDLPDVASSERAASCRALAERVGLGSYRRAGCALSLAHGQRGRCDVATAGPAMRASNATVMRGLTLLATGLAHQVRARQRADDGTLPPFRQLFEQAPGLYLVLTPAHSEIVAVSNAYLAATMVTREQIMGRSVFEVFPDDPADGAATGASALSASLARVRRTAQPDVMAVQRYSIRREARANAAFELRYWSPINSPVLDAGGRVAFIIHRVEDVTDYVLAHRPGGADVALRATASLEAEIVSRSIELKRLADSLAQSEQRFRYVTRATNDVVWDWTLADDTLWCSRSALEPIGSALAQCTSLQDWEACIHPDDRQRVADSLRASVASRQEKWAEEYRLSLGAERQRHVLHRSFLDIDSEGRPQRAVGSIADLTEQKQQEFRLRMQAEMLDYATDAILVCDLDNRIVYWNQAAVERYGWTSLDVIGRPVSDTLYAACAPADFQRAMQVLMAHGDYSGRMVHAAADGRKFVVHVHWILVRHEDGLPRAILSVVTDLSEQIELEQKLVQTQKLEALGRLTGGIAHDFNNWLTVIIGNAEELVEALADQPMLGEIAGMIQMAGERAAQLTRRLLAFARRQPLTPQLLRVGAALESLRPLIARSLPETIDLHLLGAGHDWCVDVDRAQLEASIINLCINARDAMPEGGRLTIELTLAEIEAGGAVADHVVIAIADNGHGIAPDVIDRVFEPFFTTKDEASGSGLGLSMVYGFARQSNGNATIQSEAGRGTVVKLYLPRTAATAAPDAHVPDARTMPRPGSSILLVEDDAIVREHILAQLRDLGCIVTAAANAEDALILLAQAQPFDILFSDVVMPGMSGFELAAAARRLHPGLRVLLSSGYAFAVMQEQAQMDAGIRVLNKPYGKMQLAQTLADVLGDIEVME